MKSSAPSLNWDFHLDEVKSGSDFSKSDKEKVIEGISNLRKLFGEDWIIKKFEENHPVSHYFLNTAPWTRIYLSDFGLRMNEACKITNFEYILKRLDNPNEYDGARHELDLLTSLMRLGIKSEFCYNKSERGPDIISTFGDRDVFFEIKSMRDSSDWIESGKVMGKLVYPFLFMDVGVIGKVHKIVYEPRINYFLEKMRDVAENVKKDGKPREFSEDGVLDFYFFPKEMIEESRKWSVMKGISGIEGPNIYPDGGIRRLLGSLHEKAKQLPKDDPGIVVLFDSRLSFNLENFEKLVDGLEESVYAYPNMIGLIIFYSGPFGPSKTIIENEKYFVSNKSVDLTDPMGMGDYHIIVIKNKFGKFTKYLNILDLFK